MNKIHLSPSELQAVAGKYEEVLARRAKIYYESKTGTEFEERYGRKNNCKGASGFAHQIDVSLQSKDQDRLILIEGKHWQENIVEVHHFLEFLARVIDIRAERGCPPRDNSKVEAVMIASSGFRSRPQKELGIDKLAEYYQIGIQIVYGG